MKRDQLAASLDQLLEPSRFRDYCPNGLQVEGRDEIQRVITGVSASQDLLEQAIVLGADAIVVHHGYFWRGEDGRITGLRKKRLQALLANDISLFAYHLPLDAHPQLGNNAQLAALLGWQFEGNFAEQEIACLGSDSQPGTAAMLAARLEKVLGRKPLLVGPAEREVRRIGWCSGGAQGYFEQAIAAGVDAYVSGEISEQTVHLARESGVAYLACGHHATERYGVAALAQYLRNQFGLDAEFVDLDNPV